MGCGYSNENAFQVNVGEGGITVYVDNENCPIEVQIDERPLIVHVFGGGLVERITGGGGNFDPTLFRKYNLSSQINGITTTYFTPQNFHSQTLVVLLNGLEELDILVLSDNSFRVSLPVLDSQDKLVARYIEKV